MYWQFSGSIIGISLHSTALVHVYIQYEPTGVIYLAHAAFSSQHDRWMHMVNSKNQVSKCCQPTAAPFTTKSQETSVVVCLARQNAAE